MLNSTDRLANEKAEREAAAKAARRADQAAIVAGLRTVLDPTEQLLGFARGRISGGLKGKLSIGPEAFFAPFVNIGLTDRRLVLQHLHGETGRPSEILPHFFPIADLQSIHFSDIETYGGEPACRLFLRLNNEQQFRLRLKGESNFETAKSLAEVFQSLTAVRRMRPSPTQRTCAACNHRLDQPSKFCPYCGARQEESEPAAASAPPEVDLATPVTPTDEPKAPEVASDLEVEKVTIVVTEPPDDLLGDALDFLAPEAPTVAPAEEPATSTPEPAPAPQPEETPAPTPEPTAAPDPVASAEPIPTTGASPEASAEATTVNFATPASGSDPAAESLTTPAPEASAEPTPDPFTAPRADFSAPSPGEPFASPEPEASVAPPTDAFSVPTAPVEQPFEASTFETSAFDALLVASVPMVAAVGDAPVAEAPAVTHAPDFGPTTGFILPESPSQEAPLEPPASPAAEDAPVTETAPHDSPDPNAWLLETSPEELFVTTTEPTVVAAETHPEEPAAAAPPAMTPENVAVVVETASTAHNYSFTASASSAPDFEAAHTASPEAEERPSASEFSAPVAPPLESAGFVMAEPAPPSAPSAEAPPSESTEMPWRHTPPFAESASPPTPVAETLPTPPEAVAEPASPGAEKAASWAWAPTSPATGPTPAPVAVPTPPPAPAEPPVAPPLPVVEAPSAPPVASDPVPPPTEAPRRREGPLRVRFHIDHPKLKLNEVVTGANADEVMAKVKTQITSELKFPMKFVVSQYTTLQFVQEIVHRYNQEEKKNLPRPNSCREFLNMVEAMGYATVEDDR